MSRYLSIVRMVVLGLALSLCSWANTPPTLVSVTSTAAWNTVGGTKSVTVTWLAGDNLLFIGGTEGASGDSITNPTATGLTFTAQQSDNVFGTCRTMASTATAASGGTSVTISSTNADATGSHWGFAVYVFRNSGGFGQSAEQHTATRTLSLTPLGGADSAIVWLVLDFAASGVQTITPTPTNTRQNALDSGHYTQYLADIPDQTSSGAISYGVGGANAGPFSIIVFEVKGTTGTTGGAGVGGKGGFGGTAGFGGQN